MKRSRRNARPVRQRPPRYERLLRDAGEKLELDESEIEDVEAELARRLLELEA